MTILECIHYLDTHVVSTILLVIVIIILLSIAEGLIRLLVYLAEILLFFLYKNFNKWIRK